MVRHRKEGGRSPSLFRGLMLWLVLVLGLGAAAPLRAATFTGRVINDLNGNGVIDSGDVPAGGIIVQLRTGATRGFTLAQAVTNANGDYAFINVPPGTYRLVDLIPVGAAAVAAFPGFGAVAVDATTIRLTVVDGEFSSGNNFLVRTSVVSPTGGTISGSVLQDSNGDGVPDIGDAPLPNVPIQLFTQLGVFVAQTTTNFNGAFAFTSVPPGFYLVQQVVPAGFNAISPTVVAVTAFSGANAGNINFLDRATVVSPTGGSLSGFVLRDNGNGFVDNGDTGLSGVTVQLFTQLGVFIAQTTTGVNGAYAFTNLPPGAYLVQQLVPSGHAALTPTVLSATVISGFNTGNVNFLDRLVTPPTTATISGSVVQDTNGNGVLNAGDAPLPGVTVQLRNSVGGVLANFVTDVNGAYAFTGLTPGTYQVVQFVPANFVAIAAYPGLGAVALSPTIIQVSVSGGLSGNNNFLDRATVVSPTGGSLSGFVLRDNGNGFVDNGDTGLSGVTVQLFTQLNVPIAQTTTGFNGAYSFTNLPPGAYLVQQLVPAGYVALTPTVLSATVISGFNTGNVNFLDRLVTPPTTATISGSVVQDTNGNGFIDLNDTPLPGVLVQLRDLAGNVLSQFITDARGAYAFPNVSPGTYRVVHIVPANFVAVGVSPGLGGAALSANTIQVTITGGVSGNNNFLDRFSVVSPTVGSLSGTVLLDANGDGVLDNGDTALPGVTVQLFTLLGVFIAQTTTGAGGAYSFTNLPPGNYQVIQVVPAGLVPLTPNIRTVTVIAGVNQGNINFLDSGSTPSTGVNTISGFAIRDLNVNGIADNEPGLAGMVVTLRDAANVALASTTTGVTGAFSFTGLPAGSYTLTATPPFGMFNTNALPGQGGVRLNAATIAVTTTIGTTNYPGHLFLAGP